MADDWDRETALEEARARTELFRARRNIDRAIRGCAWTPGLALGQIRQAIEAILLARLSGASGGCDYALWAEAGERLKCAIQFLPTSEADRDALLILIRDRASPEA